MHIRRAAGARFRRTGRRGPEAIPQGRGLISELRRSAAAPLAGIARPRIDPAEEDNYGSSWRREWDGRRYHTREHLAAACGADEPGRYTWAVEHDGRCADSAGLRVDADQHTAIYSVGLFVPGLRGQGLGQEITRLVLDWAFSVLGVHRVELEVLAGNARAIGCYRTCGFRQEGVRRQAALYPDGRKDFILMAVLQPEHAPAPQNQASGPDFA